MAKINYKRLPLSSRDHPTGDLTVSSVLPGWSIYGGPSIAKERFWMGTNAGAAPSLATAAASTSFADARRRSSHPWRARRIHLKTRLAFRPCRRATDATDPSGAKASSTIRWRSSRLHVRRRAPTPSFAATIWCPPLRWWTPNQLQMQRGRRSSDHAYVAIAAR